MESFLPPFGLLAASMGLSIARFENQRWVRARSRGLRGASAWVGFVVDITAIAASVFGVTFLVAYGYDAGWKLLVGLVVVTFLSTTIYSFVSAIMFRGDSLSLWMLGILCGMAFDVCGCSKCHVVWTLSIEPGASRD